MHFVGVVDDVVVVERIIVGGVRGKKEGNVERENEKEEVGILPGVVVVVVEDKSKGKGDKVPARTYPAVGAALRRRGNIFPSETKKEKERRKEKGKTNEIKLYNLWV